MTPVHIPVPVPASASPEGEFRRSRPCNSTHYSRYLQYKCSCLHFSWKQEVEDRVICILRYRGTIEAVELVVNKLMHTYTLLLLLLVV